MNKQQKRNQVVLLRMLDMNKDEDWVDTIAEVLEVGLDEMRSMDGFGSEAQNDPRGDGRDSWYSMYNVAGVD